MLKNTPGLPVQGTNCDVTYISTLAARTGSQRSAERSFMDMSAAALILWQRTSAPWRAVAALMNSAVQVRL